MQKVGKKRQITLPIAQCQEAGIKPGGEVDIFIVDGRITIVKKNTNDEKGLKPAQNPSPMPQVKPLKSEK